jgi:hypothetical protein
MPATIFDTLAYAKKLREAGVPERQAEVHAEALRSLVEDNLATKRDLKELENALRQEIELVRRDMKEMETGLRRDMKEMDTGLRRDMREMDTGLRHEMKEMETRLRYLVIVQLGGIIAAGFAIVTGAVGVVIAMLAMQ